MQLSDFDYHLPPELIAQTPAEPRDSARLLCLRKHSGQIQDKNFRDIADMLGKNDVLVVNQTRVIHARLKGYIIKSQHLSPTLSCKERGQEAIKQKNVNLPICEIFLHKQISENTWDCLVYPGKKLKPWAQVIFQKWDMQPLSLEKGEDSGESWYLSAIIKSISEKWRVVEFSKSGQAFLDIVDKIGEVPLPPYIKDHSSPAERYQTVYNSSEKSGSVAAPTAGLHFTPELLEALQKKWVKIEKVTLNVWLGTFANVETENIKEHHMHSEYIEIDAETVQRLNTYKQAGKRIIAVGTTSVRTLESFASSNWVLEHGSKDTNIFIYPGYKWKFVDSIITNFHLPKSTLLMLVSSFAGDENRKRAYQHAVDSQYRFFSFWDAMWIY